MSIFFFQGDRQICQNLFGYICVLQKGKLINIINNEDHKFLIVIYKCSHFYYMNFFYSKHF